MSSVLGLLFVVLSVAPPATLAKIPINEMHICMEQLESSNLPANADFVVKLINERADLLPNHELKLYQSVAAAPRGQEDLGPVVKAFVDQISTPPNKLMVLGPTYSSQAKIILEAASMYNLVEVAYTVTSPLFSDSERYPRFVRLLEVTILHNPAILHVLDMFNWTRGAKIVTDSEYVLPTANDLQRSLDERNFTTLAAATYSSDPEPQMQQLKESNAKIFFSFTTLTTNRIFCQAYRKGLYGPRYQWIHWSGNHGLFNQVEEHLTFADGCDIHMVKEAMEGTIIFYPTRTIEEENEYGMPVDELEQKYQQFLSETRNETVAKWFMPFVGDAVMALALAINQTLSLVDNSSLLEHFSYDDAQTSQILYEQLLQTTFAGATGAVKFDKSGDRMAEVVIGQVRGGKQVTVAIYDSQSGAFAYAGQERFVFPGGQPPLDHDIVIYNRIVTDPTLHLVLSSLAVLGILLSVASIVFNLWFRKARFIKLSSPRINSIVAIGCVLSYASIILFALDRLLGQVPDVLCGIRVWVLIFGFTLSFGSMFAKIWRVHVLFVNEKLERKVVKDWHLFVIILTVLLLDVVFLTLWEIIDPMHWQLYTLERQAGEGGATIIPQVYGCTSSYMSYWTGALYGFKALLLLFGIFFAWETRTVRIEALNDSKQIGMCVYNVVIMSVVAVPLVNLLSVNQVSITYGITAISIMICSTTTLVFVFGSKMYFVWCNRKKIDSIDAIPFASSVQTEVTTRHI